MGGGRPGVDGLWFLSTWNVLVTCKKICVPEIRWSRNLRYRLNSNWLLTSTRDSTGMLWSAMKYNESRFWFSWFKYAENSVRTLFSNSTQSLELSSILFVANGWHQSWTTAGYNKASAWCGSTKSKQPTNTARVSELFQISNEIQDWLIDWLTDCLSQIHDDNNMIDMIMNKFSINQSVWQSTVMNWPTKVYWVCLDIVSRMDVWMIMIKWLNKRLVIGWLMSNKLLEPHIDCSWLLID